MVKVVWHNGCVTATHRRFSRICLSATGHAWIASGPTKATAHPVERSAATDMCPYSTTTTTPCLKKRPPLPCYNFDTHEWISIFFGRNVSDIVGNQKTLYYAISNNCASALPGKPGKHENHIFHSNAVLYDSAASVVLHAQCTSALSFWKKIYCHLWCVW